MPGQRHHHRQLEPIRDRVPILVRLAQELRHVAFQRRQTDVCKHGHNVWQDVCAVCRAGAFRWPAGLGLIGRGIALRVSWAGSVKWLIGL